MDAATISAFAHIGRAIRETRLALRTLCKAGFTVDGAFAGGYRRRLRMLRSERHTLAQRMERGE